MTDSSQIAALSAFDRDHVGLSSGALSIVLRITSKAQKLPFPLKASDFVTAGGGQVSVKGGETVRKILQRHGVDRHLSSESGRTSRGSLRRMEQYVDLLNDIRPNLNRAEEFWVGRIRNYFDSKPFVLRLDPAKSLRVCIRHLLDQAVERQRQTSGTMYVGAVMQHLVGAKLQIVWPAAVVEHGFAVADGPTNRSADFPVGDSAIHVTTAPSVGLIEKCAGNLSVGLRPIIVTTEDGAGGARAISKNLGVDDRIDIIEIEQFLAANIYERGGFQRETRSDFVRDLIARYNCIVARAETDPSLSIELDE